MTDVVNELFRKPKKDKGVNAPTFYRYKPNTVQQADLLFLPNDDGYKYLLVVVDVGSRLTDAQPLKDKKGSSILNAFQKIYSRNTLKLPQKLEIDSGTEFSDSIKWFNNQDIIVRVAKTGRHRQQAIVERRNQSIGTALFKRMVAQEIVTEEQSNQWIDDYKDVIDDLNKKEKNRKIKPPSDDYLCHKDACELLNQGDKVRVALEAPRDVVSNQKLHGKFRDSDIRFEIKPKTITDVIIQPNKPPLYLVDNDHKQAYTKNQLLPVKKNETNPNENKLRPIKDNGVSKFIIDKILDKKKINNKIHYNVKWKGYSETTWEPRSILIKDVPHLIKEFDNN